MKKLTTTFLMVLGLSMINCIDAAMNNTNQGQYGQTGYGTGPRYQSGKNNQYTNNPTDMNQTSRGYQGNTGSYYGKDRAGYMGQDTNQNNKPWTQKAWDTLTGKNQNYDTTTGYGTSGSTDTNYGMSMDYDYYDMY